MKNSKIMFLALGLTGLAAVTACNEYLDTVPDNRTEINSVEKLSKLVASAYPSSSYAVIFNARVDFVSDKGTGYSENNTNTDSFFWRDVTATDQDSPDSYWSECYLAIAHANHAIAAATAIKDKATLPFIGEARIARAFSHFLLVSSFAQFYDPASTNASPGVPYVTEPEKNVIQKYSRGTVQSVYDNIEKDLTEGLDILGSDSKYLVPRYHFNRAAAHTFASRYYLFRGEYAKVIAHATSVIPAPLNFVGDPSNPNVDETDPANTYARNNFQPWLGLYSTVPSSGDVKNFYTQANNPSNLLLCEMASRLSRYANSWRYATKERDVLPTVNGTNPSGGAWAYRYWYSGDSYYLPKFREHFVTTSINATTGVIYTIYPFLRNEEALLNRAEAYAMLDMNLQAIADMNVFMRQRIKTYSPTANVITMDKLVAYYGAVAQNPENFLNKYNAYGAASWSVEKKSLIMFILDCRRNEFMWEGLRYWDMWRYKIPITHTDYTGQSNTLYPGDDRWMLQIPETAKLSGVELNPRTTFLSEQW